MKPLRTRPGEGRIYASDDLAMLYEELRRVGNLISDGSVQIDSLPGGILLTVPPSPAEFWARITGPEDGDVGASGSGCGSGDYRPCENPAYGFVEARPIRGGLFEDVTGGRSGECYEVNRWHVPHGSYVWMREGWVKTRCGLVVREYLFCYEGLYKESCNDSGSGSGSGSGNSCSDNPDGVHGPLTNICCIDGVGYKQFADGTLAVLT